MGKQYYLFLDESKPNGNNIKHLCLAGLIIEKEVYEREVLPEVKRLKHVIFGNENVILHESEIRMANGAYRNLRRKEQRQLFWEKLANLFRMKKVISVGSAVDVTEFKRIYSDTDLNDEYYIALQIVLENYVHFLKQRGATGQVYIEGTNEKDDIKLRNTYHKIIANGTLYFNQNAFQEKLSTIHFFMKADNHIGIQLADFVPGALNRKCNGLKPKKPSLLPLIESTLYDGNLRLKDRFGFRVLP